MLRCVKQRVKPLSVFLVASIVGIGAGMKKTKSFSHLPVMADECLQWLQIQPQGVYVDATFGRGGHSQLVLDHLGPEGALYAFDQDESAIQHGLSQFKNEKRLTLIHANFEHMEQELSAKEVFGHVDGVLMDIGVSSPQLDEAERGFSFMRDGPLDMRMDRSQKLTAFQYLLTVSEVELVRVLSDYGEERYSKRVAKAIVRARGDKLLKDSTQCLVDIIVGCGVRRDRHKHPATRTFQALRIAVNREVEVLEKGLLSGLRSLKVGGRLVVISFHGLEHRVIKGFIRAFKKADAPYRLKQLGKAIAPSYHEVKNNPRARSAYIRVMERVE